MNAFEDTMHRALARHLRRAIPMRRSAHLSSDPEITLGIATIKIVTEEQIQAIAFGSFDSDPQVVLRVDPIGRDVSDLVSFATFLNDAAARALGADAPLRIWTPHAVTVEALDVLGHRYWNNDTARQTHPEIVRMGQICRIIAHEATIPGQQLVANATALLQDHVVTGLAPIEEGHLDAILAWLDPTVSDPLTEARERIRLPASGVLPNTPDQPIDDRIDRLRKEWKGASGARRTALDTQIRETLRRCVLREWQLLVEGRRAFLGLGLPASSLGELVTDSKSRVLEAIERGFYPARLPHKLAEQLSTMEAGQEKADHAALESDPSLRQQAMRAGGVVFGTVSAVRQPRPGFNPCDIDVDTDQGVIRFRLDDKVRVVGTNVAGVVRGLSSTPSGGTRVSIDIKNGVRSRNVLTVGAHVELTREPYAFVNHRALSEVYKRRPWLFYGQVAPRLSRQQSSGRSALAIARAARKP